MAIRIVQESSSELADYARVPIAFDARTVIRIDAPAVDGDGFVFTEQSLPTPMRKDYDAIALNGPESWTKRFDVSSWAFFAAYVERARVGGAAVVMRSPEIELLEGREDLALLWDIRAAPAVRRSGIGTALLRAVESWALDNRARSLKVETQDVNVPACRFYEQNGFVLRTVNRHAYPDLPDESQLLWYKDLVSTP